MGKKKQEKKMIPGIIIEFEKDRINQFHNKINYGIDPYLLIDALFITVNDICKDFNLPTKKEQIEKILQTELNMFKGKKKGAT